jgi:GNAT superfamily N-acetyltransferase
MLPRERFAALAAALGEGPDRVISVARLQQKQCRAYVLGGPEHFEAAIVEDYLAPDEPAGYGQSATALWELLQTVPDWTCINVARDVAAELGQIIQAATGKSIRYYGDVCYSLTKPLSDTLPHAAAAGAVRQLTADDHLLLASSPVELREHLGDLRGLITERAVATALDEGTIVAIAQVYAESEEYADIGVFTMEAWRNRGLATAAAAILIQGIQAAGKIPAWSTGEDNYASMKVAEKLGFSKQGQRTYVIPMMSK